MQIMRWLGTLGAAAAGVVWVVRLIPLLTGPIYCGASRAGQQTCVGILDPMSSMMLFWMVVLSVVTAVGIVSASAFGISLHCPWRRVLWATAVFLLLIAVLGILTIGRFVLPSAILMLAAALAAQLVRSAAPRQAHG